MLCRCCSLSPDAASRQHILDVHTLPAWLGSPWQHRMCGKAVTPLEQCLSICISVFLPQLPGGWPSPGEHLGGGRDGRDGGNEKAGEMGVKGCKCFLGKP